MTAAISTATHQGKVGEWDADPHPTLNLWTIGNSSEVVPGISGPWFSTAAREHEYGSALYVAGKLGVLDLVPCAPPPAANWAAVIAGRWALNLAWFNVLLSTFQVDGPSGALEQFISSTDGQDITAAANSDPERARKTLGIVRRLRGNLPRTVRRDRERVEKLREKELSRDFSKLSDKQLWRHLQRRFKLCAGLLGTHLLVSLVGAGDYTDRLSKFLDRALPGHDPALVIALTSALRDVESARPAKGAHDVALFIRGRKKLAEEVRQLSPNEIAAKLRRPEGADWKAFKAKFDEFIALYGFRGQGEVDPTFADWEEEPEYALSTIKSFLGAPESKDPHVMSEQAARAREAIEAQIAPAIPRALRAEYRELLHGGRRSPACVSRRKRTGCA